MTQQSVLAQIVERRTYLRPLDANGTEFETREQAWRRVINHQTWLWERAKGTELNSVEKAELEELFDLFMSGKATVSGRTRWLGGTEIAKTREASQFNCSFGEIQTVHDVVDSIWLLLQGCGVGFSANIGVLNGFTNPVELELIRSTKQLPVDDAGNPISCPSVKGTPDNVETFDRETGIWTIKVGDSAEAWAKLFGKILAFKESATKLVIDCSEIRPAGYRLSGYGWISSGDTQLCIALEGIVAVMNRSAGKLLSAIDMLDIENWLGTILSSRRSAEIALYTHGNPEWEEFALAKKGIFDVGGAWHRSMSNNSLVFYHKPTKRELKKIFRMIEAGGGSEPGFINGQAALTRAPYFKGVNPCAEILLGDKSFCNLVEIPVSRFNGDEDGLHRAMWLAARANYRQTCVNLDDGVLQRTWHELNQFLRLCGVGLTGIVGWEFHKDADALRDLRQQAVDGAYSMADELGTPRPQLVTTVKPSGTQSKVFGHVGDEVAPGAHLPLGRFLEVRVIVPATDPLLKACEDANYRIEPVPNNSESRIVVIPVEYANMDFDKVQVGDKVVEVNNETAISQLERYKLLQDNYVDHNCSITIYYSPDEVPDMVDWLMENWDSYVGVSFLYRPDAAAMADDPKAVAAQLGYPYLPQTPVTEEAYRAYVDTLLPINLEGTDNGDMLDTGECEGGACPIR